MSAERDLAEAIYEEIIAVHSVAEARLTWAESEDMRYTLALVAHNAIDAVLARRVSEAARTGPWDAPCDEREACARHIEAIALALRDHGPTTPEGVLTGIAGAQVGALLDAAASLRNGAAEAGLLPPFGRPSSLSAARPNNSTGPWAGGHHFQEEDGYPGSLLPPKRGAP